MISFFFPGRPFPEITQGWSEKLNLLLLGNNMILEPVNYESK